MLRPRRMRGRPWHEAVASEVRRLTSVASNTVSDKVHGTIYLQLYLTDTAAAPAFGRGIGQYGCGQKAGGEWKRRRAASEAEYRRGRRRREGAGAQLWRVVQLVAAWRATQRGRKAARQHPSENHQSKKEGIKKPPPTVQPTKQIRKKECGEEGTARAHK